MKILVSYEVFGIEHCKVFDSVKQALEHMETLTLNDCPFNVSYEE